MAGFHDNPFDDATHLKLKVFGGYVRKWLPVFLTRRTDGRGQHRRVNIFDFFAGPGRDGEGNPGSPLIIVQELKQFCHSREDLKDQGVDIRIHLNDANSDHVDRLQTEVAKVACGRGCCSIQFSTLPFADALSASLKDLLAKDSANLVIMDQFGVKEVTPQVVQTLAMCARTDILFFISSAYIHRFIDTPEIGGKFDMAAQEVRDVEYASIHRFVCAYFREQLGGMAYFLAPFSIRKGPNIYGVIFGSNSLLGLDKFLQVCWKLDPVTGEANYNIDGDFSWSGEQSLFREQNTIRKVELFAHDLKEFVKDRSPTNKDLYEFCLTRGFLPSHVLEILRPMRRTGEVRVVDFASNLPTPPGAFYIDWEDYNKGQPRVRFVARS